MLVDARPDEPEGFAGGATIASNQQDEMIPHVGDSLEGLSNLEHADDVLAARFAFRASCRADSWPGSH